MKWISELVKISEDKLYGKSDRVKLALTCLLSGGHLLIEDTPGVGKTTFVTFLAHALGLKMNRIQFTNDLLPSDILGANIFDSQKKEFFFKKGPIFGELILSDEINRGNSKTQSALLQAMEEKKVSIDGTTYDLLPEHTLIATQNPHSQIGTFPLPESQLDRFMMKISMGTPEKKEESRMLMENKGVRLDFSNLNFLNKKEFLETRTLILSQTPTKAVVDYIVDLLEYSRLEGSSQDLSTRCGIDLVNAMKAYRYVYDKKEITPEDVQFLFPYVAGHRLVRNSENDVESEHELAKKILSEVNVY